MEWDIIKIIAAIIGAIAVISFIGMSTWSTLCDLYAFFFQRQRFFIEQYGAIIEKTINDISDRLGLFRHAHHHRSLSLYLDSNSGDPSLEDTYQEKLKEIIGEHIEKTQARVGSDTKVNYEYYVDLRASLTRTDLADILGAIMVSFIRSSIRAQSLSFDYVAAHREGSTILAYVVAHAFGVPLLLANRTSRWSIDGKQIFVEGDDLSRNVENLRNKKVLLVDDSASGGTVLRNAIQVLTAAGYEVRDAFVLFSRSEVSAEKKLKQDGVSLHSIFLLDDAKLAKMSASTTFQTMSIHSADSSLTSEPALFPYSLRRMNLYVNLICPNRCKHCCVGPKLNGKQMTYEEAKKYVDMVAKRAVTFEELMILGGEPSVWLHTPTLIEYAKSRGIRVVSLCTSGYDWTKVLPLKHLLDHVVVSLDGFSKESHDAIRGQGSYDIAIQAIEAFIAASLPVKVIFTANSTNIIEIQSGLQRIEALGVMELNFHVISDTGYAKEHRSLFLSPSQWIAARQQLALYSGLMKVRFPIKYATAEEVSNMKSNGYHCMLSSIDRLNIFPGGECYACCLFIDTKLGCGAVKRGQFIESPFSELNIYKAESTNTCPAVDMFNAKPADEALTTVCIHWKQESQIIA